MSERLKFVGRLLEGERMTDLCREFGISRKTGYKIFERYRHEGVSAFSNQSRKPHRHPNRTSDAVVRLVLELREKYSTWGAPKIRDYLRKKHPGANIPAISTLHAILDRNGFIAKGTKRRRFKAQGTQLQLSKAPNDLWCADFKGQFRLGNKSYCYPLTITDHWSRFLLCVDAQENTKEGEAIKGFERTFREFGIPRAIRTDNGVPFSTRALFGLSKLSVWWLRLGIRIERIEPGHPEQNGVHERMHLTLKQSTTQPPGKNLLQQQEMFDSFIETFNHERPHAGIQNARPGELYKRSATTLPELLPDLEYPAHDQTAHITACGSLYLGQKRKVFLSEVFAGQSVGLTRVDEQLWKVTFINHELGYFDDESLIFSPHEDPFSSEETVKDPVTENPVSPMSPE